MFLNDFHVFSCVFSNEFFCFSLFSNDFHIFLVDELSCFSMFSNDFHGYSCVSQWFPCIFMCFLLMNSWFFMVSNDFQWVSMYFQVFCSHLFSMNYIVFQCFPMISMDIHVFLNDFHVYSYVFLMSYIFSMFSYDFQWFTMYFHVFVHICFPWAPRKVPHPSKSQKVQFV